MAKRKTPKVKDLVEKKITEDQLKEIQQTVSMANQLKLEIGNLEATKHRYMHELDAVNNKMSELNSQLEEEYGKVDVNINTGAITYPEDEQADS
mgnify:CR=1 FL=1